MNLDKPISTYEIVILQIKALDSILGVALSEVEVDKEFLQEIGKIKNLLEDFLQRYEKAEELEMKERE